MRFIKIFAWVLITIGLTMMSLPLISGFTGFFHSAYFSAIPKLEFDLNIHIVIIGAIIMVIGLLLAKPKKETLLSSF